jgi:hypothetical protein
MNLIEMQGQEAGDKRKSGARGEDGRGDIFGLKYKASSSAYPFPDQRERHQKAPYNNPPPTRTNNKTINQKQYLNHVNIINPPFPFY